MRCTQPTKQLKSFLKLWSDRCLCVHLKSRDLCRQEKATAIQVHIEATLENIEEKRDRLNSPGLSQ